MAHALSTSGRTGHYVFGIILFEWNPINRTLTTTKSKLGLTSFPDMTKEIVIMGNRKDCVFVFSPASWAWIFYHYLDKSPNPLDPEHGIFLDIKDQ